MCEDGHFVYYDQFGKHRRHIEMHEAVKESESRRKWAHYGETFITILIVLNALAAGAMTYLADDSTMEHALNVFCDVSIVIFIIEILIRIFCGKSVKEFFKGDKFAQMIGAELLEMGEGYAKARMLVTPQHLNGAGQCQGGALFTLADLAFAAAVNSHGNVTVAISSNITFVSNVAEGYVYAEAHEVVNHHKVPYCEVRVTSEDGTLLAILNASAYRKKTAIDKL
jgi:acyl-CoA thioesterase